MLGPGSKQHQWQLLCSFLPGLFACVGCVPRGTRRRARGRVASPVPPCAVTLLLQRLQDKEGDRAQAYCELEHVLREGDSRPPCGVVNRLLAEVSQDLTAAQGVPDSVRMAASDVLVALARTHFSLVMAELQGHLKAVGEMSKEFVLLTLSKLFTSYAPQCIPFVWLMLAGLRSVVGWVRGGRTLRIACAGECRPRAGGAWGSPCTSPCCRFSQVPFSLNLSSFFFSFFFFFFQFYFF
ncbi:maestro heat-like repeat-containing protein family member 2A isoform X1 [Gallus gallus]|uniref:maestro heat-like repeat-containing protein family member 2A isoform X1 n=1 Tax=Gallus gallus TaxID=9031 RepID=UPI001AEA092E|nr:maestro heat-like repeat-containing protein family member 2A isoform X1 [Gallus gallus]